VITLMTLDRGSDKRLVAAALALCLLAGAPFAHAAFGPAAVARDWCKKKTLHYLEKRGYTPYNWEATTYIEGDNYVTEGAWRVDVDDIKVQCMSSKHAKKASGRYKILNVDITDDGASEKQSKKK